MGQYIWGIVNSFCVCVCVCACVRVCGGGGGRRRGGSKKNSSKIEVFRLFIFRIVSPILQETSMILLIKLLH